MLGLDPGLARTGYAAALIDPWSGEILEVAEVGIIETHRTRAKELRKTSDYLRRASEHWRQLKAVLARVPIDFIAAEMASTTPYTYPTFSFGVMTGILAALDRPIIEVLPHEAKTAATGSSRATKREVIAWALDLPSSQARNWPTSRRTNRLGLTAGGHAIAPAAEHPADALGVIQAALRTEQFRLARSFIART